MARTEENFMQRHPTLTRQRPWRVDFLWHGGVARGEECYPLSDGAFFTFANGFSSMWA
jgi:hypothetical protein